jgi:hypothetical protein
VSEAEHPTADLDDVVHQPHRLGVLTIAAEVRRVEFGYLRETLGLTAGNLSRHITVLEEAGLVEVQKGVRRQAAAHVGADQRRRPVRAGQGDVRVAGTRDETGLAGRRRQGWFRSHVGRVAAGTPRRRRSEN